MIATSFIFFFIASDDMVDHSKTIKHSTILKVKKQAYYKLEQLAIQKGVIYGGYVRDQMISEEFTKLFMDNHPCNAGVMHHKQFWDKTFSPATSKRLIIPNDMDVCFYSSQDADNFIASVKRVVEFDEVHEVDTTWERYYSPMIQKITHLTIRMAIGRTPFITRGTTVIIQADIIVPKPHITIDPPFNNIDMLCNGFVKTNEGIRYSQNTGTAIDFYTKIKRMQVVAGIAADMLQFKSYICFSKSTMYQRLAYDFNLVAMTRIMKLHNKGWSFLNMPFKTETYNRMHNSSETDSCIICCSDFVNGDTLSYTVCHKDDKEEEICGAKMHYTCCMQHLNHQKIHYREVDQEEIFVFKCPYRTPITFNQCINDIEGAYLPKPLGA